MDELVEHTRARNGPTLPLGTSVVMARRDYRAEPFVKMTRGLAAPFPAPPATN